MNSRVIDLRGADAALYPVFVSWWKGHAWDAPSIHILPRCAVLVTTDEGEPAAVAWLYMDNSGVGVAWMEWTVANPALSPRTVFAALKALLSAVRVVAVSLDYGVLMTTARQASLIKIYERGGFTVTDTGVTHLVMLTKE
jgi:hypothetical protein